MPDFTGLHFALMGGNLLAGTAIGWFARTITGPKSNRLDINERIDTPPSTDPTAILADLSQTTATCSKELKSFEYQLDQLGDSPTDGIVTEIRVFGQSYSKEVRSDVGHLADFADRQDTVIRQVIAEMVRHSEHVDKFNRSVGEEIDQCLPEKVKTILSVALTELLDCNHRLESELNNARRELEKQRDELANARRDARIDPLTKIANRRSFEESHCSTHAKFIRSGESYSIAMFDLDHFKKINDTYGHSTGDVVLQVFARVLQDAIRKYDVAARYGGEEFILMLPNTSQKEGTLIAERIRRQTATKTVRQGEKSVGFTVSAGIAVATPEDSPESLLKRADTALYHAKRNGRNRVQFGFAEMAINEPRLQPTTVHPEIGSDG